MYMIHKIYDMCLLKNRKNFDLGQSGSYLALSSMVLFIFLFRFSNTNSLNYEDEGSIGQAFDVLAMDLGDDNDQGQSEGIDSQYPLGQKVRSTKGHEHCFEQDVHFDSIFEEWVRIEHRDGSYTYEYRYRYEYNYNYQYWYNLDKCVGPLPETFTLNNPPVPLPLPHDGNPYPAPTP